MNWKQNTVYCLRKRFEDYFKSKIMDREIISEYESIKETDKNENPSSEVVFVCKTNGFIFGYK